MVKLSLLVLLLITASKAVWASSIPPPCPHDKTLTEKDKSHLQTLILQDETYKKILKSQPDGLKSHFGDCLWESLKLHGSIDIKDYFNKPFQIFDKTCSVLIHAPVRFTISKNAPQPFLPVPDFKQSPEKFANYRVEYPPINFFSKIINPKDWTREFMSSAFIKVAGSSWVGKFFNKVQVCQITYNGYDHWIMRLWKYKKSKVFHDFYFDSRGRIELIRVRGYQAVDEFLKNQQNKNLSEVYALYFKEKTKFTKKCVSFRTNRLDITIGNTDDFKLNTGFSCLNPDNMCEDTWTFETTTSKDKKFKWSRLSFNCP